jgi:outer membrane protein assembly factor BamB
MSDDFVTRLQLQLREAAERETRRGLLGRVGRAALAARRSGIGKPLLVGVALACSLAIAAATLSALHRTSPPAEQPAVPAPGPKIVADGPLAGQGGAIATGFGAIWAGDADTGELLRVDPRSRRVLARVSVGAQAYPTVGAGAVWATADGRLIRIDPATNRVVARIPLGLGARAIAGPAVARGVVWVVSPLELLRIDPRSNTIDRRIGLDHQGYQAHDFASDQDHLYVLRADRVLLTLNAATGARESSAKIARDGFLMGAADGTVAVAGGSEVAAVDARSGRTLWRADLGATRINYGIVAGPNLWIHVTYGVNARDRLVRLDSRDGHVTGSLTLPEFGVASLAQVGDDIWIVSPNGRVVIVR